MNFMYFFDNHIKRYIMRGKKYCNPAETGNYPCGISCIRQHDVNLWFYTKNNTTIDGDKLSALFNLVMYVPGIVESANIHLIYSHTHMNPLNSASKNLLTHMLPMMHLLKIPIKHH